MKEQIKLGDKVRDMVSGYEGIAVARTLFLNGCVQYVVVGKLKKGERLSTEGEVSVDEGTLKLIKKRVVESSEYLKEKPKPKRKQHNGGPTRFMKGMRGY